MKKKTYLARSIRVADEKAQYDAQAKKIISDKMILAWIAKYAVEELKEYSIPVIISCIEGEPEVATVPVYPGEVRTGGEFTKPGAITGLSTEDKVPNEGEVTYDIRFYVITPKKEILKIIINVEIQKDFYPGYDLVTRAIFYCARMLSAQLDTEFTADNYNEIKKVYSIWLCLDAPDYLADTITQYSIKQQSIVGEFKGKARYDLLSAVMVCLNEKSYLKKKTPLHGLLGTIFSEELRPEEKTERLHQDYEIETDIEVKEGMSKMCNLSDAIEERGIKKGLEQGLVQGQERKLIELICRKVQKGKDLPTIADELEEEESVIQKIYEAALKAAPEYDREEVYGILHEKEKREIS